MTSLHFDYIEPVRRCRARDPLTSVVAAEKVGRFANSHAAQILRTIKDLNEENVPASQSTIAWWSAADLTDAQVSKRLPELFRAGLIAVEQRDGADWVVDGQRCWRAL